MTRGAVLAVIGLTVALAGVPGSAGAQEDWQKADVEIGYRCDQPDGPRQVVLRVTATFPTHGAVGDPVLPKDVTLALSVPPDALPQLTAAGAVAATSVVKLDISIVQGDTAASATWLAVQAEPVPFTTDGPAEFTATSGSDPVTAHAAGDLSFTAGGLVATVTGRTVDGVVTEPPVTLSCIPDTDQRAGLAVVPVSDDDTVATPENPTVETPEPEIEVGKPSDESSPFAALGTPPPECHPIGPPPGVTSFQSHCANAAGYANVAKLKASVLQPTTLVNVSAGAFVIRCDGVLGKFCSTNTMEPNYQGRAEFPPASGSFFSLGLVPTTGSMQMTPVGPVVIDIWFQGTAGQVTARLKVNVRIFDARINGVPFDVGPNCRTATPLDVVMIATPAQYSLTNGGVLTGTITIPPFSGCGATENIDPLFTALVSGPGNYLKMTQGKVCSLGNGVNCPPEVPIPKR
jgi:hypothetical protein